MANKTDPRHGIWILPLVIVAMVGATIIFVNALTPADELDTVAAPSTGPAGGGTTSTTSTTVPSSTTTLPPEAEAYLLELASLEATAVRLVERAIEINRQWDDREVTFQVALDEMRLLEADTADFVTQVEAATPTAIPELEPAHLDITIAARAMEEAANAMVEGLLDPNSSEGRKAALLEYEASGAEAVAAIEAVQIRAGVEVATSSADENTTTTQG